MQRRSIVVRVAIQLQRIIPLALLASFGSISHSSEGSNTPPLLETAQTLQCAANHNSANDILKQLKASTIPDLQVPNEWIGTDHNPGIHAATFDIIIDVILGNIARFPQTTQLAESILLGWNYCAVHHSGKYFDLSVNDGQLTRTQANEDAPLQWSGFKQLGVSRNDHQRYIPKAFSNTQRTMRQQLVYNWWKIQRSQCLPHPGNGDLYYQKTLFGPSKISSKLEQKSADYPYTWPQECALQHTLEEHQIQSTESTQKKVKQIQKDGKSLPQDLNHKPVQLKSDTALPAVAQREAARAKITEQARAHIHRQTLEKQTIELEAAQMQLAEREYELAQQINNPTPATTTEPADARNESKNYTLKEPMAEPAKQVTFTTRRKPSTTYLKNLIEAEPAMAAAIDPTKQTSGENLQSTPPLSTSTAFPSGSVPPFVNQQSGFKDRKYHGISGSFALSNNQINSGNDGWSVTANFGYKPIRSNYFFARGGLTLNTNESEPTYYWGLGYNDWHTGTWAFELNHWGPLEPGDGLQLKNAVASLSYKFDSLLLKKNGLSSSFSVSGGANNAPTATLAGSWTPKANWFVRTLVTQPLEGGPTTWAYGFGYSDWREKTWALEYNNWGTNEVFDLNFRENALVTLSWKWGF